VIYSFSSCTFKVLIPIYKESHFLNLINESYKNFCDVSTNFNEFWLNIGNFDIIHLHWPEYLFKWQVPTELELLLLERTLNEWHQKGSKIVITRHNYLPHRPNAEHYIPLYNLIYSCADVVVHMGKYSEIEYLERYRELIPKTQQQAQIPHPIFNNYPNTVSKVQARQHLNIGADSTVMLVFGEVRKASEKNLILQAFDMVPGKDKILLVPGWKFSQEKEPVNRLKWLQVKHSKKYRIAQKFVPDEEVQYFFNASDFVFLPRLDTLNSGVPFLSLVFDTPFTGANTGNIGEVLRDLGLPYFEKDNSQQLQSAILKVCSGEYDKSRFAYFKSSLDVKVIGKQYAELFRSVVG
jgi:hypothetical protein